MTAMISDDMKLSFRTDDWVIIGSGKYIARICSVWENEGKYLKQYFELIPDCPHGCLEGDGGYTGKNDPPMQLMETKPILRYCYHCDEENYGFVPYNPNLKFGGELNDT